jgi:uroporphyrinogen decarboxylase
MLCDFLLRPDMAEALLERTTAMSCAMAARYAEAGVDIIYYGEDIASQQDLLMHIRTWRKWLKPRLARVIESARRAKPDIHFLYHSDGNVARVVPELIEIGVDVLNPIQPECMDPAALKRQFGDRLAFNGGISVQKTMPWGTPSDVRREVKQLIATVGQGGGLVIAPAHVIEPEVPWENIVAFHEAVDEYGCQLR